MVCEGGSVKCGGGGVNKWKKLWNGGKSDSCGGGGVD